MLFCSFLGEEAPSRKGEKGRPPPSIGKKSSLWGSFAQSLSLSLFLLLFFVFFFKIFFPSKAERERKEFTERERDSYSWLFPALFSLSFFKERGARNVDDEKWDEKEERS